MGKKIFMAVTADEYELPVAISESTKELGRMFGMGEHTVRSYISRGSKKQLGSKRIMFISVDIEGAENGGET